jgi:Fe-S cluster biogenesis protein NfuA
MSKLNKIAALIKYAESKGIKTPKGLRPTASKIAPKAISKKVAPVKQPVAPKVETVAQDKLLPYIAANGGHIKIHFVKVNGQERTYEGWCKNSGAVSGNKINFNLEQSMSDVKLWRGSRLDTIVKLAFQLKSGAWCICHFRNLAQAQYNAAAAMNARINKKSNNGPASAGMPF